MRKKTCAEMGNSMFRNKEFRKFTYLYLVLAVLFAVCGFAADTRAGVLIVGICAVLWTVFFIFTSLRYKNLVRISDQIDLVLHNENYTGLEQFEEGELSILHSEINKMMLRIREQNDSLKKDRTYLADALADIAHQLRTPLTSLNLVLSFLAKASGEEERKAFAREAEELLVRMDWLIRSLLKISRLDAGVAEFQNETVELKKTVQSAYRPLAIPMELRNIDMRISIPGDITIQGDSGWLTECFQNILKNCMESIERNGLIHVSCEDNVLYTEVIIRDSGAGFHKEDIPHIFDRFYRSKNNQAAGYGIGLALCKMIVIKQNGTITASNSKEGGAVFRIRFSKVTELSPASHREVISE